MSEHKATVDWQLKAGDSRAGTYSREHAWTFAGGLSVPASPSPLVVRPPMSNAACVDPEEAFVASIASCHLLTFLHLAAKAGFEVTRYQDEPTGVMTKNDRRIPWVSVVTLRLRIEYGARRPTPDEEARLHHEAHEQCFIADSVETDIRVEGTR